MLARELYLDLMKRCLTNSIYGGDTDLMRGQFTTDPVTGKFKSTGGGAADPDRKYLGGIWPSIAHTMIGFPRLNNLQQCVQDVLVRGVPGDFIETGVWRGGASIFMRAILKAYAETGRTVWVADSFEGLPEPTRGKDPAEADSNLHKVEALCVSLEDVRSNFAKYGLLDSQVRFLKGWFKDSLPAAPIERLAVLRADGDYYESTMDALVNLYPKLSAGGYLIIDDYNAVSGCNQAVEEYRREFNITTPVQLIEGSGAFWKKE